MPSDPGPVFRTSTLDSIAAELRLFSTLKRPWRPLETDPGPLLLPSFICVVRADRYAFYPYSFAQSMFNAILYGWTPEAFPAHVRGTAAGSASFVGRIFGIVAPLAATRVLAHSTDGVLYLAGGSVFICTLAILLLPKKVSPRTWFPLLVLAISVLANSPSMEGTLKDKILAIVEDA